VPSSSKSLRFGKSYVYYDSWKGKQYKGKVSKNPLELRFSDRFLEDGWVALDTHDEMNQYSRDVFRLKLDDALKLIAFGKANKLEVSLECGDKPVEGKSRAARGTIAKLLTNFINGLQRNRRNRRR